MILVISSLFVAVACSSSNSSTSNGKTPVTDCKVKVQEGTTCNGFEDCPFVECNCIDGKANGARDCIANQCASACYVCPDVGCKEHGGWDGTTVK
jgi:hypothetical protein